MNKDIVSIDALPENWVLLSDENEDSSLIDLRYESEDVVILGEATIFNNLTDSLDEIVEKLVYGNRKEKSDSRVVLEVVQSSVILNSEKWHQVSIVYAKSPKYHLITFLPRKGYYLFVELVTDVSYARSLLLEETKKLVQNITFSRAAQKHIFKGENCYYCVKTPEKSGVVNQGSENLLEFKRPESTIFVKKYGETPSVLVSRAVEEGIWSLMYNEIVMARFGGLIEGDGPRNSSFAEYKIEEEKRTIYTLYIDLCLDGVLACIVSEEQLDPLEMLKLLQIEKIGDDLNEQPRLSTATTSELLPTTWLSAT